MDIVHGKHLDFAPTPLTHRTSGLSFKFLFEGEEGAPEKYQFAFVRQRAFYSPVHKHNFDQVRYAYSGNFSIAPSLTIKEGELAYHPEGVSYGPQDDGSDTRVLLILQFGGSSGQGYLSKDQLLQANKQLAAKGRFDKGRYYPEQKGNSIDGFQALWEHCNGRELIYPRGRYHTPILMTPDIFSWTPIQDDVSAIAYRKLLGVFSERGVVTEQLKIGAGGYLRIKGENAIQFLLVLKGAGKVNEESFAAESAIRLQPGSEAVLATAEGAEILHYVLPMLTASID
ncbi:hypothetical protein MMC18_000704 [Xylographa bjoerkii]|nr:hypothetical protein [Xylographa bjoerkii]